jgi:hypothetical protein
MRLVRARLIPFNKGGSDVEEKKAIAFDFNPETLTLKVTSGQQKDKARQGRQQVQNVGASSATLSFDAIFDSTRPRDNPKPSDETQLDVRRLTKPIADLLQAYSTGGKSGGEAAPRKVRFHWGNIIFNGIISSHEEVFDFFSPGGTPLRSKVKLTLTEQEFRYEVKGGDVAAAKAAAPPPDARSAAANQGADALTDLSSGQLSAGLGLNASLGLDLGLSVGLEAKLGISADIGLSLSAGVDMNLSAAVDVFGSAAFGAALGGGAGGGPGPAPEIGSAGVAATGGAPPKGLMPPPSSWAPDGPKTGSRAASLAGSIAGARASGGASPSAPVLAVRGSAPPRLSRAPASDGFAIRPRYQPPEANLGDRRPRWEGLAPAFQSAAAVARSRHPTGCGCHRCGCG